MKKDQDDFSAFDSVMAMDEDDFSSFDSAVQQPQEPSQLERILSTTSDVAKPVAETALDFSRGAAQGMSFGFADELGAAASTLLDPLISRLSGEAGVDEQLRKQGFDVQNQGTSYDQELAKVREQFKESEERSPVMNFLGDIAGSIPSGQALGGLLGIGKSAGTGASIARKVGTEAVKAAPGMALEMVGRSEAETPEGITEDALAGAQLGAIVGGGMQLAADTVVPGAKKLTQPIAKKVKDYVADSPYLRQLQRSHDVYGMEYGVNPTSEKALLEGVKGIEGGTPFAQLETKRTSKVLDVLEKNRKKIGQEVENVLDKNSEVKVNLSDEFNDFITKLNESAQSLPSIINDPKVSNTINSLMKNKDITSLTPKQVKSLMTDINNIVEKSSKTKYGSMELEELTRLLSPLNNNINENLKNTIPEYRKVAEQYNKYMKVFYEQPISGDLPLDITNVFYGNLGEKGQQKLFSAYQDLIEGATSSSNQAAQTKFTNLLEQLKTINQGELPLDFDPKQFSKQIKDYADDAALRKGVLQTRETEAGLPKAAKLATGFGETGRAYSMLGAQKIGKYVSKPMVIKSKALYSAPKEDLLNFADRLSANKSLGFLGQSLKEAVENNDSYKRNATLFTILQNPQARLLLGVEEEK